MKLPTPEHAAKLAEELEAAGAIVIVFDKATSNVAWSGLDPREAASLMENAAKLARDIVARSQGTTKLMLVKATALLPGPTHVPLAREELPAGRGDIDLVQLDGEPSLGGIYLKGISVDGKPQLNGDAIVRPETGNQFINTLDRLLRPPFEDEVPAVVFSVHGYPIRLKLDAVKEFMILTFENKNSHLVRLDIYMRHA